MKFVRRTSKKFFGTFLNFPKWFGLRTVTNGGKYLTNSVRNLFDIPGADSAEAETFEQAVTRLGLTEKDIKKAQTDYLRNTYILTLLVVGLMLYGAYLAIHELWFSFILVLPVIVAVSVMSIWSHFWYFQIKHRRLGCSLREWLKDKPNR